MNLLKAAASSVLLLGLAMGLASCGGEREQVELSETNEKATANRLAPAGELKMADGSAAPEQASAEREPRSGKEIYDRHCMACHSTGAAGAPRTGDASAWESVLEKGIEQVYANSIQGVRGMPPRGLCMDCTNEEVEASVDYIVEESL